MLPDSHWIEEENHEIRKTLQRPAVQNLLKKQYGIHVRHGEKLDSADEATENDTKRTAKPPENSNFLRKRHGIYGGRDEIFDDLVNDDTTPSNSSLKPDSAEKKLSFLIENVDITTTEGRRIDSFDDADCSNASLEQCENVRKALKKQYGVQARDGESFEELVEQGPRTPKEDKDDKQQHFLGKLFNVHRAESAEKEYPTGDEDDGEVKSRNNSLMGRLLQRSHDDLVSHQDTGLTLDSQTSPYLNDKSDSEMHHHSEKHHHSHFPFMAHRTECPDSCARKEKDSHVENYFFSGWKDVWTKKDSPNNTSSTSQVGTTAGGADPRNVSKNLEHQNMLIVLSMGFALFIWVIDVLQRFVKLLALAVVDFKGAVSYN